MSSRVAALENRRRKDAAIDRARRFDRVLLELSLSSGVRTGTLEAALREICTAASKALGVARTNVWLFDDESHSRLREAIAYERRDSGGLLLGEISTEDNPPYFAALQQERIIAANDVYTDPRTMRFATTYLRPRGISSMLDAAVRLHGRLLGCICAEHVGTARTWDAEEERFAASLGDLVALALADDQRASAQLALRESEARYRLLVDGARDLIFNLDPSGTVTSLNPALADLLAHRPEDWTGKHFGGLIDPQDLPKALALFGQAVAGEDVPTFEIRLRSAAGAPVWFEFRISVQRDEYGIRSVFGVGRDIGPRKWDEARRRLLADLGQALAHNGDDVDAATREVHELVARELGCARIATVLLAAGDQDLRTIVGSTSPVAAADASDAGDVRDDDDVEFPPRGLARRAIERNETSVLHLDIADPRGDEPLRRAVVASPLRTPEGVLGAMVSVRDGAGGFDAGLIDLLDQVARELGLYVASARRRREARDDAAVSAALARVGQELMASVDLPLLLDRLCRVTVEVLECDVSYTFLRDETRGAFVQMASFGDPPQLTEALRTVPVLDEHTHGLVELLEKDHVQVSTANEGVIASPVWRMYGTSSAIIIALMRGSHLVGAQAASLRRQGQQFLPRHIRIARGITQLASLAIANARLVAELEAASRIKSDFVATISHELRTPLNVIIGYTDLLLQGDLGDLDSEQTHALKRLLTSAIELQELIEATLDLSRLEAGNVTLRLEEITLESWLREVETELAPLRERKPDLRVEWRTATPGACIVCDPMKLKVILKNLVGNAIKFTHEGFVEIDVSVQEEHLALTVRDSGIGMSPKVRAVIFDAFRQGDASMTRPYGGVGLGLYIVSRLIDTLRGRIDVASEPGKGSTFAVELPLDPTAARA